VSRALLLVGSPKSRKSASRAIGDALISRLAARGWGTLAERIPTRFDADLTALFDGIADAELVVLSFPVYVDTLPAPVTRFLQEWSERGPRREGQRLVVLTQCGFPEAAHCASSIEVCRNFAGEVGVTWAGALTFGMGPSVGEAGIEHSPIARALPSLDAAADALAAGESVPDAVAAAFARPTFPAWLYVAVGGLSWRLQARQQRADAPLRYRRYAQEVRS